MCKILLDHLFAELASGDAEVSPRPKMPSPVSLFHHRKFFKNLAGRSAFDASHYFRWRDVRRSGDQNVDMVFAHDSPQYLNLKSLTDLANKFANSQGKVALKYLVTVFRNPHEVVLDLVLGVAATAVVHAHFLKPTAS